ncbi:MAG: class IV adenylate cyclase [Candidatus Omnitrophica bacterium]|nr:class IV adenylate cyclase [Candidatus Omnitrophota bacterium]
MNKRTNSSSVMEYEVKFKVSGKKEAFDRIKNLNAECLGKVKEVDVFFKYGQNVVRVRDTGKCGLITFKEVISSKERVKVRRETETKVSNVKALIEIFEKLGFKEFKRLEKIRYSFKTAQGLILVDRLPFLGYYLELEAKSFLSLQKLAQKIGVDSSQAIISSYQNIFFNFVIKNAKKFEKIGVELLPIFEKEKEFKAEKRRLSRAG